jgi:hypothetical protein
MNSLSPFAGAALSSICSSVAGAGWPPRIVAYHLVDLTKGAMRGLSWVFFLGNLLSLSEIARDPASNALVASEIWLYVEVFSAAVRLPLIYCCRYLFMGLAALTGAYCGTYFRQFVSRRALMYGMYLLLWVNSWLLLWPFRDSSMRMSMQWSLFCIGSVVVALLSPVCYFHSSRIRAM